MALIQSPVYHTPAHACCQVAEGLDSLVLDVKVGRAAFMPTLEKARELAHSMVGASSGNGVRTVAVLTEMDHPIGRTVGNAIEVIESIETLKGNGPADLVELTTVLGGHLLHVNGSSATVQEGIDMIQKALTDGSALAKFRDMMVAQGVTQTDADAITSDPWKHLPLAPHKTVVTAAGSGYVTDIDAMVLAITARDLGAGRLVMADVIDYGVALHLHAHIGSSVSAGDALITVYHTKPVAATQLTALQSSYTISTEPVAAKSRIIEVITA